MSNATERISLSQDERWPTYVPSPAAADAPLGGRYNQVVEVDRETGARWQAAIDAFDAVQDEMAELFEASEKRSKREAEIAKAEKAVQAAEEKLRQVRDGEVPA